MKKVVRLNENDIENLVKKIISEENKSINEGPLGWMRKKFNSDEEVGLAILKGIGLGEAFGLVKTRDRNYHDTYTFELGGHNVTITKGYDHNGMNTYSLEIDNENMEISRYTLIKIVYEAENITDQPRKQKLQNIKTSMSRYNLPDEERKKLEDTDTYFEK